jgi:S-adenosylmethionine-dependent methyltransferase
MDDISDIRDYYDTQVEKEETRLERHQLERDITLRYLGDYLPADGKILEVGAATGAYTLWLAQQGYSVVAVDLTPSLLQRCRERLMVAGLESQVDFRLADARNLTEVPEKDFEAVLLMGPLYHLVLLADRQRAIQQVYQRLKPGGMVFSSFISRYGLFGDLMNNVPEWIHEQADVRSILARGYDDDKHPKGGFRGYFSTTSEIIPLHEEVGFKTVVLAGSEPCIASNDESYNRLDGVQRQLWLDVLYEISREPTMVAASRHLLYIGQKCK